MDCPLDRSVEATLAELAERGIGAPRALYLLGTGAGLLIQGGPVVVDLGYRYNKISAGNAIQSALTGGDLGVHQVRFGLGVRF